MSIDRIARCPHCAAVYKVLPQQLSAAAGRLRCGACHELFDSTGMVLHWRDERDLAAERVSIDGLLKSQDKGDSMSLSASQSLQSFEDALATFAVPTGSVQVQQDPVFSARAADQEEVPLSPPPDWDLQELTQQPRTRRFWLWGLLVLALMQVAWGYRQSWLGQVPWPAAWVRMACAGVACATPQSDALLIDASRFVRTAQGYRLEWSWHNAGTWPMPMPAAELSLLGEDGRVLVRRVMEARTLGGPDRLQPAQEWTGALELRVDDALPVTGYRLLGFFP